MNFSIQAKRWRLLGHDIVLLGIMMILAACGLIYEYLLSHYAGRVLGIMESTIYAMIGLMIVAMGIGAWCAKWFKLPFSAFAWLELLVAFLGACSVLIIAAIIALTDRLPGLVADIYNMPPDTVFSGGLFEQLKMLSRTLPYWFGFLLGLLIGMEIPLIAKIREEIYGRHLQNNVGTIYGADYIGAGIGAVIWVKYLLTIDITMAAAATALLNVVAGSIFLIRYWSSVKWARLLIACHIMMLLIIGVVIESGNRWMSDFSNVLYRDKVLYQTQTRFQSITFTQRYIGTDRKPIVDLYLNGRLQFSSLDESIYHAMLVYPAMLASARHEKVLIIGGGDGLALRDVLNWQPEQVTLVDLDEGLVELFSQKYAVHHTEQVNALRAKLMTLNRQAFEDPRVDVIFGDAFIEVERLLEKQQRFDAVIIDLPDPSHPDLNKLYSDYFYARVRQLVSQDGIMVVQSTSPFHAKNAYISIAKTVKQAGFLHVEQYRQNVPTFGEWGWTIASKAGRPVSARIAEVKALPVKSNYVTTDLLTGAFAMPAGFYQDIDVIKVNFLGSGVIYDYHTAAWQRDIGVFAPGNNE
ncbi:polyamine aminopropyltransferase [Aliikangiella maris]|uniref:Polyamine aminopropyltransferase n=2 Tax=Aliikangiella maris TaxID=3162458 RepID=A0ABV2BRA7_9GAMM